MLEDMNLVEQLIDQVYQFSRMYWESTNQHSLLITIKYLEMVAEIYPHFLDTPFSDLDTFYQYKNETFVLTKLKQ
ncbi:MAG: hypothetical protein RLZZ42_841 [Bacteroidota bacterium]